MVLYSFLSLFFTFSFPVPQRPSNSSPCHMPAIFGNSFVLNMPLGALTFYPKHQIYVFPPNCWHVPSRRNLITLSHITVIETAYIYIKREDANGSACSMNVSHPPPSPLCWSGSAVINPGCTLQPCEELLKTQISGPRF